MHEKINKIALLCTVLMTAVLSGCQVVSVKEQAINVTINNERDSILTRDKLSEASLDVLSMTGREAQVCENNPEECVKELQEIPQILDEQLLSTSSELYLAKSLQLGKSAECKTSALAKTRSEEKQQLQTQNLQNVRNSSYKCWIKVSATVMPICFRLNVHHRTGSSTTDKFRFVTFITWQLLI